jgi:hypothetical protein
MSSIETKQVQLSECTVSISQYLTWGEKELIQAELATGAQFTPGSSEVVFNGKAILDAKYRLMEIAIKSIKNSDGTEIKYSREWASNLSQQDGDLLYSELEQVQNIKKK